MEDYTLLSDTDLQRMAVEGDSTAENELVSRYSRLVRICARPFFLAGGDSEDLIQEGMLGLLAAIREYHSDEDTLFKTFAEICIRRRMLSAIKSASRMKHAPLNEGISLEEVLSEENQSGSVLGGETFRRIPEEQVLARESKYDFLQYYSRYLSKFEKQILMYYLDGLSYAEIASVTGKPVKSVDNAVQRIRNKLAQTLPPGDFS